MKRIAIIGGSGFIGSRLALSFAKSGVMSTVFDIAPPPDDILHLCHFVRCDIRAKHEMQGLFDGFDAVFLLAALLGKGCEADCQNGWQTNARGTGNVLMELARARKPPRVVFTSTGGVYASPARTYPTPEDSVKAPIDLYSTFKLASEAMIASVARSSGLQAFIFRFFSVYGPGPASGERGHFVASWLERARNGLPLIIHGNGEQTRDFTHVSDVVAACHKVLEAPEAPAQCVTYNIGSGREATLNQVAQWITEELPGVSVQYDPRIVPQARRYIGDIERARRELGYDPQVMAEEGIKILVRTNLASALPLL